MSEEDKKAIIDYIRKENLAIMIIMWCVISFGIGLLVGYILA